MKVVVVGLGYVGLSNALVLAQNCEVVGVDISADCVDLLNRSISQLKTKSFLNSKIMCLISEQQLIYVML